jgi:hypothetical protein
MRELSKKYGCEVSKNLVEDELFRYQGEKEIGGIKYALLKEYGKDTGIKVIPHDRCQDLKAGDEAQIFKSGNVLVASPSEGEIFDRKIEPLRKELGVEDISFRSEIGDRGKYGGVIEFEGNKYGVMNQYKSVVLIDKEHCSGFKEGQYIKLESYRDNEKQITAVPDFEKQQQVKMERQMELEMSKGFEMEM